jgi:hypothetical protein
MRAFFDDMLAAIFVLAVLAASYIFLFMGTVQSGTMMTNALQHRIKIEQLQSTAQAFRHITEPNTGENLAYLVGLAASTSNPKVWVGEQQVNTIAATEGALEKMLGSNYLLSVELPSKQLDLVFVIPQSPTMVEERDALLEIIPEIRNGLGERKINATIFTYFLSYNGCSYEWCDNSTKQILDCSQMQPPTQRGYSNYNIGSAIASIAQVPGLGFKVIIPITDSLSTGDAPDSCFNACNTDPTCSWCSTTCSSVRSDYSLRQAALRATTNRIPICPITFSKCSYLDQEARDQFTCLGLPALTTGCGSCSGCEQDLSSVCFKSCETVLQDQMYTLSQATGCITDHQPSNLLETVLNHVDKAILENKFKVGTDPPKDHTIYSEDVVLPVTPPLRARLTIW